MTNLGNSSGEIKAYPNKPLVTNIFTADPSAHVFDGKLYIYPSHDQDADFPSDDEGTQYRMIDYHVLSMDSIDSTAKDHGVALALEDIPWAKMQLWAPDAAYKNGKYYLVFPAKDKEGIFRVGVAVSDSPTGPFKAEENFIEGTFSVDPAVFTDDDGTSYLYWGGIWGGQLQCWKTGKFDKTAKSPEGSEIALLPKVAVLSDDLLSLKTAPADVKIVDENGKLFPASEEDKRFFEGSWMHKYNGKYYFSYSTGTTHLLVYAVGDSPMGPFVYKGKILEPVTGWTTHHSIVEYSGKWYLFYHDNSLSGVDCKRCVKYTELTYNDDGTIKTITP